MSTPEGTAPLARRLYFGWWVVSASMVLQVLRSSLLTQSYSAYAVMWQAEFGWSSTAIATAFALQQAAAGLASPLLGWLLDRLGPRRVITAGALALGAGFMMLSGVDSLAVFYLTFAGLAVGGSGLGLLSMSTVIVNWFERRRSLALSLTQTGQSLGGLLVPVVVWSLTGLGWRATALISGLLVLGLGLPAAQLMRRKPEDLGLEADDARPARPERAGHDVAQPADATFTTRQALATRAFWLLSLGHGSALMTVSAVLVHFSVYLNADHGYSLDAAALYLALLTACTILGQLAGGPLGDRYDKRLLAALAMLGHAAALVALVGADSSLLVSLFAVVHGLAWGVRGPIMLALPAEYFGRKAFATVMGYSSVISMAGMMAGPVLVGFLADRTAGYTAGLLTLAVLNLAGAACLAAAKRPKPGRR